MEYANDKVFDITYNADVDRLQFKKQSKIKKVMSRVKKNKFFSIVVMLFLLFSIINFCLIYYFMEVLQELVVYS